MRRVWQMGAASAALMVLASCAGRVPNQAALATSATSSTTPTYTTPSYTTPTSTMPGYSDPYSTGAGYGTSTGYDPNNPYGSTTTAMPSQPLMAQVTAKKNGVFLGLGKFTCTVTITNPAQVPQSGNLKVSILDSGKSVKDFNETVSVPAGQTVTRNYEDPHWMANDCSCSITPAVDPNAAAYGSTAYGTSTYGTSTYPPSTTGMGATGPYGMY